MTSPGLKTVMKVAILAASALALAACSSDEDSGLTQSLVAATTLFNGVTSSAPTAVSRDQAAAIPFATIGIRAGNGVEQLLVMGTFSGSNILWGNSASGVAVLTEDGRIVQATGFGGDLTKLIRIGGSQKLPQSPADGVTKSGWDADFADLKIYSARIDCEARAAKEESISILGTAIAAERIDETCHSAILGWSFANTYWVNPATGFVWMSVQNIHPGAAPLTTEILRPPSKS